MFRPMKDKFNRSLIFVSVLTLTCFTIAEITAKHKYVFLKPALFFLYMAAMIGVFCYMQKTFDWQKEMYISIFTHDLTVPVQSQTRTMDYIISHPDDIEENRKLMYLLRESNSSMESVLNSVISAYKLEERKQTPKYKNVEMTGVLREVIQELSYIHNKKILNNCSNIFYITSIDRNLMHRAIGNILTFCLDNSERNKDVSCNIYPYKSAKIQIELSFFSPYLKLETVRNMFKKFTSSKERTNKIGASINLYLASLIIRLHMGSLEITKDENDKFTIKITLRNCDIVNP